MTNSDIEIQDTGIPDGVVDLVARLPDPSTVDADSKIVLRFAAEHFVYNTGLALLATWRAALPSSVVVDVDDSACRTATQNMLRASGFKEVIAKGAEADLTPFQGNNRAPFQPILLDSTTEKTIKSAANFIASFTQEQENAPFKTLLSELCENAYVHAEFQTPGYLCAKHHQGPNRVEIAIVDSGIGIRSSYMEGENEEVRGQLQAGESALDLAVSGRRSSKKSHYGYGLHIVKRLVEENFGRLTVISDDECINIERYHTRSVPLKRAWNGTFIGLLVDLDRPLPLDKIYDEFSPYPDTPSTAGAPALPESEVSAGGQHLRTAMPGPVEIELVQYGKELLTREMGIAIRADLATVLASGVTVKVILDGVTDITPSVGDECFGKLAQSIGLEAFRQRIILAGGSPLMSRLIELVVANRIPGRDM